MVNTPSLLSCLTVSHLWDEITQTLSTIIDIPLCLIIALASCTTAVHDRLGSSLTCQLVMRDFHLNDSQEALSILVTDLFISPTIPLAIVGNALSWLIDNFHHHRYSFQTLSTRLHNIIHEHFSSNRWSFLCGYLNDWRSLSLSNDELREIASDNSRIKSLRNHVDLTNDFVRESLEVLSMHRKAWSFALRACFAAQEVANVKPTYEKVRR